MVVPVIIDLPVVNSDLAASGTEIRVTFLCIGTEKSQQNLDAPFPHRPCTVFSSLSSIKTYCSTVALQHPCKGENTQSICSPMAYCRLATTMYKYSSHHFLIQPKGREAIPNIDSWRLLFPRKVQPDQQRLQV